MTSRDFCFWLQGFFEIVAVNEVEVTMTPKQIEIIQKHLSMVFKHEIDPNMGSIEHQEELNNIHNSSGATIYRC